MSLTKPTFREKVKLYWYELLYLFHILSVVLCVGACAGVPSAYAAEAGSATAADIALKGGMSLIDGTSITSLFVGLSSVIASIGTIMWYKNRNEKKRKERPLDSGDLYVRCAECAEHRKAINSRIDNIQPMLERISNQVEQSSSRAEERAVQLHRRLDPIVERVAANSAKIDVFEELARKSTLGKN